MDVKYEAMKKLLITLLCVFVTSNIGQSTVFKYTDAFNRFDVTDTSAKIVARSEGSITFVVDENLAPIEERRRYLYDGERIAKFILADENIPQDSYHIIATSFSDAQCMESFGKDAFYNCIVRAYANHQSVTLSPDMIWLLISQGFARYVNAHAEEVRHQLVSHEGKMDLVIQSEQDLLSEQANWPKLIDGFASQIDKYTKGDIAKTITADFTTTSPAEKVTSQITLMESVKSYFEYIVIYISCGIPNITLKGTPEDWQKVLEKTRRLEQYGIGEWTRSLEPILTEFIKTAEGKPNQKFWQGMVKKQRIDKLKGGGCSPDEPTKLDGWILKFFPDKNGQTLNKVPSTERMPAEYVRVGFKFKVIDPIQGTVAIETPMELWAGFVGAEVDTLTNTLTPKIGWLARVAESEDEQLADLRKKDENWGIEIRVKEVPEILGKLQHIKRLNLEFTDAVVLPEWFDRLTIDRFVISGKMTEAEKAGLEKRFPKAHIFIK